MSEEHELRTTEQADADDENALEADRERLRSVEVELDRCWDLGYEQRSNVVEVYIRYLREKIDRPFGVGSIETVRGAGYRLRKDGGKA